MPVVCFAARLLKDKGIYEFISAAEILNKLGVRAKFVVAGDLDLKNPTSLNLKELNKLKENKNIEIIGYQKIFLNYLTSLILFAFLHIGKDFLNH